MEEWALGLAGYSPEQIKRGLDSWKGDWPPSLPEFKNACIGSKWAGHKHFEKITDPSRLLGRSDSSKAKAVKAFEEMEKCFG